MMDEDEPQAIDELLKYLYTLSDHINVLSIDESMFHYIDPSSQVFCLSYTDQELSEHPEPNPTLVKEVTYLVDVLVAADKYGVCDLAAIAGQKIDDRLEVFRYWAGRLEPRHVPRLTSAFSDAVQFEDEMPLLEKYQHDFLATVTSELDIHVIFADVEFILAHPKLTREVLWHRNNALTSEREKTSEMLEDMPKTRRHRYQ